MSICDKDVAVTTCYHIRWLIEGIRAVAGDTRLAERQQDLPVRTKFDDDVPLSSRRLTDRRDAVCHPDVPLPVDIEAVWKDE